jgi:Hydantoinase/oxoprolinase/Hydantoinase/oxoprolinase N-terminal region
MTAGSRPRLRVGVDIGGTFTDLVFVRPDGLLDRRKRPSTPADYSKAIVEGIAEYCAEVKLSGRDVGEVVHATTVATNAILERRGARTGLITTEGFRDVLELRRIRIPLAYDLGWNKPEPLVERAFRLGVRERLDAQGHVLTPLDGDDVERAIDEFQAAEIETVAVCFLHAYRNATHERAVGARLRERLPGVHVSLSSDVLPEMLEFERTSTTVVNAYIAPLIARYLDRLRETLAERAVRAPILVMQSNGGLISASSAAARPVTIIESGPAAGVVAAQRTARACGYPNVITLDMGGTTTKASIIEHGEILRGTEYEVGSAVSASSRLMRGNGYLLRIPVIDISEVGAGGGSIAALDAGGSLRVGPRSAGAVPGLACYGPRQRATDGHRRQSAPRLHQRDVACGGNARRGPRAGGGGGATPRERAVLVVIARCRARHSCGREFQHGARDQVGVGRAGPRSRRLRDDGVRRRRTDPCCGCCPHARHQEGGRSTSARRVQCAGPAACGGRTSRGAHRVDAYQRRGRSGPGEKGAGRDAQRPSEPRSRGGIRSRHRRVRAVCRSALSRTVVGADGPDAGGIVGRPGTTRDRRALRAGIRAHLWPSWRHQGFSSWSRCDW